MTSAWCSDIAQLCECIMAESSSEKTVLVQIGERARPVKFVGGSEQLLSVIKLTFQDILNGNEHLLLQVGNYMDTS